MANKILVFIEQRNGKIKKSSVEAVKVASNLAEKNSFSVEAVAVGNEISDLANLGGFGAIKVTHFQNPLLQNYSTSAYTELVSNYAKEIDADIIIFSNTALGKDLAPHIAVRLEAGIATDVIDFNLEHEIIASRPVYGGKALIDIKINRLLNLKKNIQTKLELLENIEDKEFPLFLTVKRLVLMIDGCLQQPWRRC